MCVKNFAWENVVQIFFSMQKCVHVFFFLIGKCGAELFYFCHKKKVLQGFVFFGHENVVRSFFFLTWKSVCAFFLTRVDFLTWKKCVWFFFDMIKCLRIFFLMGKLCADFCV